jgi:2-hydroxychromene-2-carboxylate isomerase
MGQLIHLHGHRSERSRPEPVERPAFFFDVACPLSYLSGEGVERRLGQVEWIPVDGGALRHGTRGAAAGVDHHLTDRSARARAEARARALRLPLVWPDTRTGSGRCARRACAFASEIGAGARFALAASRLAFCGGFDLDDPDTLAEAATAAGVPLADCLTAAGEAWRDEELQDTADVLRSHGIGEAPAIRIARRWFQGEAGLVAAGALLGEAAGRRLAPAG